MRKLYPVAVLALIAGACARPTEPPPAAPVLTAPVVTNRIDIPQTVRQNLGITFARVERRHVAQTLRVPGRFEARPDANMEVHAPVAGRINVEISQYQVVEKGTLLFSLDSPQWRQVQNELGQGQARQT